MNAGTVEQTPLPNGIEMINYEPEELLRQAIQSDTGVVKESAQLISTGKKKLQLGFWSSDGPGTIRLSDYLLDEICVVLSGSLSISDDRGIKKTFQFSDIFKINKGFTGTWNMNTAFRKFFIASGSDEELKQFLSVLPAKKM